LGADGVIAGAGYFGIRLGAVCEVLCKSVTSVSFACEKRRAERPNAFKLRI